MPWAVVFVDSKLEAELLRLQPGFVARFIRYAERMEIYGPDLGMPHTRPLGDGLFELRLKGPEGIVRVFHCVSRDEQIVMLHYFADFFTK
jgi:phage-related protein